MKVQGSVRELYNSHKEKYDLLKTRVDKKISARKRGRWHYESRIKPEESFALKIETGRYENSRMLEDFLACTIVVGNQNEIETAIRLVNECNFKLKYRRPPSEQVTFKRSNSFPFDDLRLYVEWEDDPTERPLGLSGLLFEIQIKTYLQHAWAIATHDLVYKTDSVSWPKERIAYQVKAMLEHAEVSIAKAEDLARSPAIRKEDKHTKRLSVAMTLLRNFWSEDRLPKDLLRLAENVNMLASALGVDLRRLKEVLEEEAKGGRGPELRNLSPYGAIFQSIIKHESERVKKFLDDESTKFKLVITREIEVPSEIEKMDGRNILVLD